MSEWFHRENRNPQVRHNAVFSRRAGLPLLSTSCLTLRSRHSTTYWHSATSCYFCYLFLKPCRSNRPRCNIQTKEYLNFFSAWFYILFQCFHTSVFPSYFSIPILLYCFFYYYYCTVSCFPSLHLCAIVWFSLPSKRGEKKEKRQTNKQNKKRKMILYLCCRITSSKTHKLWSIVSILPKPRM